MKKAILRVLLLICGLNVFTACYGMPPGGWDRPDPLPEEQQQAQPDEESDSEESDEDGESE